MATNTTQSTDESLTTTDVDSRTRRALEEAMSVVSLDGTAVETDDETVVMVVSHTGESYHVDAAVGRWECPDHEYRDARCKHIRRAQFALGLEAVDTAVLAECDVDARFGVSAPGPVVETSEGEL